MKLRRMTAEELATVLDWAAEEGWNPGLDDAAAFYAADPEGFFVAEVAGTLAAAISVVNHSESFAFLGLYICRPAYRGRGVGYALWRHALEHAGSRTVGLDGVPAQQENYRRSGFVLAGETLRFEGAVAPLSAAQVRAARPDEFPILAEMEAEANGYTKARFAAAWLAPAATRKTLVFSNGEAPEGFVTIRQCRQGHKIGPLIASDIDMAIALIHAAAAHAGAGRMVVDVPSDAAELTEFCRSLEMGCAFNTARMYRGPVPEPGRNMRTIATLELG